MTNILSTFTIALSASVVSLALSTVSQAQTVDPKLEWATKVVALQQGPELNRLVDQLANNTSQDLLQKWGPKLQTNVPKARLPQVTEELNAELQKYSNEVSQLIGSKVGKVSADALIPAYMEKFSIEELQQIALFFESPAIKKYQASAPELGNIFIKQLVEAARGDVSTRAAQFDETAAKIIGAGATPKASSAPSGNSKPPIKK
jgi:hypothetical protein